MNQPKFKPGQQWLTRDTTLKFHILSINSGKIFCVCITKEFSGMHWWFYSNGQVFRNTDDIHDLVTLVKDVE